MACSSNAVSGKFHPGGSEQGCAPARCACRGLLKACRDEAGVTVMELVIVVIIVTAVAIAAVPAISGYMDNIHNTEAVSRITNLELCLDKYYAENGKYPDSLARIGKDTLKDPWGRPFVYVPLPKEEKSRRGVGRMAREHRVINTDYDLYSLGKNGRTDLNINKERCWDDILRAYNGSYAGQAKDIL